MSGAEEHPLIGSNNWVISGAHTVSGKPLLSNDMHLGHQMPNLWYEAHLRAGKFDVAGVTLPGLPYVIVGHNQRIAWGFTNIGPTVEDVYMETTNGDGEYLTPDGWKPAEHRREVIHVKGKPEVVLDVVATRHGPIITELVPQETRKLALRWTLYDGTRNPFFDVDLAQNWDQFRQAFSHLDAPGTKRCLCRRGRQHWLSGDRKNPHPGGRGWQLTGARRRRCFARMDWIHPLRRVAPHL